MKKTALNPEEFMKAVLENAFEMMLIFDQSGRIIQINHEAEKELGYMEEEICSKWIWEIFPLLFMSDESGVQVKYSSGQERVRTNACRKNMTCFLVDVKISLSCGKEPFYLCVGMNAGELEEEQNSAQTEFIAVSSEGIEASDRIVRFGTKENDKVLWDVMEKMVLCVELGIWEKAEQFAAYVNILVAGADISIRKWASQLENAIKMHSHAISLQNYEILLNQLIEGGGV